MSTRSCNERPDAENVSPTRVSESGSSVLWENHRGGAYFGSSWRWGVVLEVGSYDKIPRGIVPSQEFMQRSINNKFIIITQLIKF